MKKLFVLLVTGLFLASCGSTEKLYAPNPVKKLPVAPEVPASVINLPLSLKIKELENKLNATYPSVLYEDNDFDNNNGDNLIVKVTKTDTIRLKIIQDVVYVDAPIQVYVKGRLKKDFGEVFGQSLGIEKTQDANFRLVVHVKSKLGITPDWQLSTKTETSFDWVEKPSLSIAGLSIPIGQFVQNKVNDQIRNLSGTLDQEITKRLDLKSKVEPVWQSMFVPRKVNEQYNAWLLLTPQSIGLTPLRTDRDNLFLNLSIRTGVEVAVAAQPRPVKPSPLPKLRTDLPADSSFNLQLVANLSHEETSRQLNTLFAGKEYTFENGKHNIFVESLQLSGTGEKMLVGVKFKGKVAKGGLMRQKVSGEVWLAGKPVVDTASGELRVKEVDFELESRNFFAKSAQWMFKGKIEKEIQEKMVFPVKAKLEEVRQMAEAAVNSPMLGDKVKSSGKIRRITPSNIRFTDNEALILLQIDGLLNVKLQKL